MKTCTIPTPASMHRSTSPVTDLARPQTTDSRPSDAISRTVANSSAEDAGKPASMTLTPMAESCRAISILSAVVNDTPGVCSPSRRVVSKTEIFLVVEFLSQEKATCRVHYTGAPCLSIFVRHDHTHYSDPYLCLCAMVQVASLDCTRMQEGGSPPIGPEPTRARDRRLSGSDRSSFPVPSAGSPP